MTRVELVNRITSGMLTSLTDDWGTPREFFDGLNHEFGFRLDACAAENNAKVARFYSIEDDGLAQPWAPFSPVWLNPPYGRAIGRWMEKAHQEAAMGATIVALVPARTDTAWWHDYCIKADEIRFVRGRLRFYGRDPAPFPSAVVIWRGLMEAAA